MIFKSIQIALFLVLTVYCLNAQQTRYVGSATYITTVIPNPVGEGFLVACEVTSGDKNWMDPVGFEFSVREPVLMDVDTGYILFLTLKTDRPIAADDLTLHLRFQNGTRLALKGRGTGKTRKTNFGTGTGAAGLAGLAGPAAVGGSFGVGIQRERTLTMMEYNLPKEDVQCFKGSNLISLGLTSSTITMVGSVKRGKGVHLSRMVQFIAEERAKLR